MRACLAGNSEAFRPLVERYERMVRGMIARLVDEEHLIEELAHRTFIGAFENLAKYEGRGKFATWLGRIAINKTRDYLRARKRRDRGRLPFDEFDAPHEGYCPEAEVQGRQNGRLLALAMQSLKDETRRLIVLRYLHECAYREIAERIGCSEGAAKVRCWRAVTLLRRELERLGAEP
ncbi:sigma-70 family RNA polymerase sigma factor [Salinisphaera sp. PC39]|uniref:RNA polymerase sigma factor n=1 Tax=Salinisphaera sp. PC39 TaxID=1304156 RepID=UPI0033427D99